MRPPVDRHYNRLIVTELSVAAQLGFSLAQWNDFHGAVTSCPARKANFLAVATTRLNLQSFFLGIYVLACKRLGLPSLLLREGECPEPC
jgi:hypothetical protein